MGMNMQRLAARAALVALAGCGAGATETGGGRTIWRVDGRGWGIPAVDAEAAYFSGWAHDVVAVDKRTGAVRWRASTGEGGESTWGLNVVAAGSVVAVPDVAVHAFDRATGARRWTFRPDGDAPGSNTLGTDGATIYAASPTGRVYALDAETGSVRWTATIAGAGGGGAFSPRIAEGVVYVGLKRLTIPNTGALVALDAATGTERWRREFTPTSATSGTGVLGGVVFLGPDVIVDVQDGRIVALDRATGAERWTAPPVSGATGGSPDDDQRPLAASGAMVIAGSTTGVITALDAATGARRWTSSANRGSAVYPLASDAGAVYVEHVGGQLAAFDAATGAVRWIVGDRRGTTGEFYMSPALDGDQLFIGGRAGFYALRAR